MKEKPFYRTVILSDIHLGTRNSKAGEAAAFLKSLRCKRLILNGDIVDGWALSRGGSWLDSHTKFIRTVLKKMEKEGTEVIYLRGNHDDVLTRFLPVCFGRLQFLQEYTLTTDRGNYLVVHGDGFDSITTHFRALAWIGAIGYEMLLRINRFYNHYRAWRGKEYFSLSKEIKARVKSAVSFVDNFEEQLRHLAESRKCSGVICGHIHTAADKKIGEIHYLNSGDWVESLTGILEEDSGEFRVVSFETYMMERAMARGEKYSPAQAAAWSRIEPEEEEEALLAGSA
ncbi:MAG: UDP-2,3-diacylglucosamine diphosphatase [Verrucomicrobiales bacterium]